MRAKISLLGTAGAAAAEFAVTLPILVLIIVGVVDYGQAVNASTKLYSAARAGAQYALYHPGDSSGITSAAQNAVNDSNVTVSSTACSTTTTYNCTGMVCTCIDSTGTLKNNLTCNLAATPPVIPSPTNCTGGTAPYTIGHFYNVTTNYSSFNPVFHLTSLPVLGRDTIGTGLTMSGWAQLQVQ